jgi:iron complex transport system substrate-binding protein
MINKNAIICIALVLMLLAGCGCLSDTNSQLDDETTQLTLTSADEQEINSETKVVVDTTGVSVEMPQNIESIAVVPIPWTSIVYAIDGTGEKLVGIHPSAKKAYSACILKDIAPEIDNASTDAIGKDFAINMEEIQKLDPDVMIVWDYQTQEAEQLKSMGIPAVSLKYGTLEDLQNGMKAIGQILGKEEKANSLVAYHQEQIAYFQSKEEELENKEKPRVLYLRDGELKVAGQGAVNTIMIQMAGGENVAEDVPGQWTVVTMEQIIAWDPEIIIVSHFSDVTPEQLYNNSIKGQDWSSIDAVKNNRVYKSPIGIYRWDAPCSETPLMIKWMAQKFQPEVFDDYVFEDDLKEFYKTYLGYDLSQEEIDQILQKELNG